MRHTRSTSISLFALPLLASLIFTGNVIVTKLAAGAIAPGAIGFYRWVIAAVLLTPFVLPSVWRVRATIRRHALKLATLGALGMALYQGLAYVAAAHTSATRMGIITSLIPLLTVAVEALMLRERPSAGVIAGGVLSLCGLSLLISGGDPMSLLASGIGEGDLMMLLASLAYAVYGVLVRKWALPLSPWQSLYAQISFGLLFQLPAFLLAPHSPLTLHNLPLVLYAGIFPSLFAAFLWMQSIRLLGPSRTSIFMNVIPIATALIAAMFLGEPLQSYDFSGGAITLLGVLIVQLCNGRTSPVQSRATVSVG